MIRTRLALGLALLAGLLARPSSASAGANPAMPFYGYGAIVAHPHSPIAGENTHFAVTVANPGDAPATNVQVKLSYNDWGVTYNGWQEIGTVTLSIPAGGTAIAEYDHVFQNRAHTCIEALIVGADENTDPNDDRGQINLEVLSAGETLDFYVPVVNNGDDPLHLLLVGKRVGDPAGVPDNDRILKDVLLAPGEEIRVPVHLDLSDTPVGAVVEYVLDAFPVGASAPLGPAARNHVRIQVRHETARRLKTQALQAIQAARDQAADRGLRHRLDTAAAHVTRSLAPGLWLDDNHVSRRGEQVFAQEQAAVLLLLELLKSRLPAGAKADVDEAARALTDADRILAQTAASESGGAGGASLAAGDVERGAGEYPAAIRHYAAAWRAATR